MNAVEPARSRLDSLITSLSGDDDEELTEILRNMPNIEVGRGISFKPKNESYKLTMRFRMQNMVGVELNKHTYSYTEKTYYFIFSISSRNHSKSRTV